jgi:mono/diheme cytochrome c family protein
VDAGTLNQGREGFMLYCYACHGEKGDGKGPASHYLRPPPRDFRSYTFKFTGTPEGLPHDQDLERIVKGGLEGTAMLPWDVPPTVLKNILHYIKTFSPLVATREPALPTWAEAKELKGASLTAGAFYRVQADAFMNWLACYQAYPDDPEPPGCNLKQQACEEGACKAVEDPADCARANCGLGAWDQARIWTLKGEGWRASDAETGERIVAGTDPWGDGKLAQATARGKALYHGFAQCGSCHANYATEAEITEVSKVFGKEPALRPELYYSEPKLSSYTVAVPRAPACGVDADCATDPAKKERFKCVAGRCDLVVTILPPDFTVNPLRAGSDLKSVYRTIRAGIPGTAMPPWSADKMPAYKEALARASAEAKEKAGKLLEAAKATGDSKAVEKAEKEAEALQKAAEKVAVAAGDKDIWALAHYIEHLVGWKDKPEAWELKRRLLASVQK